MRTRVAITLAAVGCFWLTACGDDETTAGTTTGPGTTTTTTTVTVGPGPGSGGMGGEGTGAMGGEGGSGGAPAVCGDGMLGGTEVCDDGNTVNDDGCSDACAVETGWNCDGMSPSTCTSICGDGLIVDAETCDDGNTANDDGCSDACAPEAGWNCDSMEPTTCTAICGDGLVVGAEGCDDGNLALLDGCDDLCVVELGWSCMGEPSVCMTGCGDGIVAGTEACDDGNLVDTDGCSMACAIEAGFGCIGSPSVCELLGTDCAYPIVASDGFAFSGSNIAQYIDDYDFVDTSCQAVASGNTSPDIVFEIALNAGDALSVYDDPGSLDVVFQVLAPGQCGANLCAAKATADTAGVSYVAPTTGTYYVVVESFLAVPSSTSTFNIVFDVAPLSQGGRDCSLPIVASDGFQFAGSNINLFIDDYDFPTPTCLAVATGNTSPDIVFEIALTAGQSLGVKNLGNLDAVTHVLAGTCGAMACAASFDDPDATGVSYVANATGTYYVVVESFAAAPASISTYDIQFDVGVCGDGIKETFEACDDSNTASGDGCSALCAFEPGFVCTGSPSVCVAGTCADPVVMTGTSVQIAGTNIAQFLNDTEFSTPGSCATHSTITPNGFDIVVRADLLAGQTIRATELGGLDSIVHILGAPTCGTGIACAASYDNDETIGMVYTAQTNGPVFVVVESWANPSSTTTFDFRVQIVSTCGDSTIAAPETCDDGNLLSGDGCSSICQREAVTLMSACPGTVVSGFATNLPMALPNNVPTGGVIRAITIPQTGTIQSMAIGFDAQHTSDGDIDVWLLGPTDVTERDITTDNGGTGHSYVGTLFEASGAVITTGTAPFFGIFAPEQPFSFYTGQTVTGNWTLRVADDASGFDYGSFAQWDIAFCVTP